MVHYAIPEIDAGAVIMQEIVPIQPNDTLESFAKRVHEAEHRIIIWQHKTSSQNRQNMKTRHCLLDDSLAWLRLRNALWPDDPADNEAALRHTFAGNALACDQVIVAETDDGVVVGFIELSIRNYAEGSDNPSRAVCRGLAC